jgi:O-antigen/teichoic acid export membrane protein
MIALLKTLAKNPVIEKTVVVTVGTFTGSVFAYLLQIFLARSLSVEDFGAFTALLSLSLILGVLTSTFTTSLIKLVATLASKEEFDTLTNLFAQLVVVLFGVGFLFFSAIYLSRDFLSSFLLISDLNLFTYFGVFLGISFLSLLPLAYLQGLQRFRSFAAFVVLRHLFRFFFPVIAIVLGFGLVGVFSGMILAVLISLTVGIIVLNRDFIKFEKKDLRPYYKSVLSFAGAVLFVQIGMTFLNNVDVILVKHFFDETSAGLYAGLVTVGKVLLFGASTVGVVMFPMISASYSKKENYMMKFKLLFAIQLFVVVVGIFAFTLGGEQITRIMFGETYVSTVRYLPKFSLFVGSYVLINFMILFLLAIEKVKVFLFLIPAILAQVLLIFKYHSTISNIINVNLSVSLALLLGVIVYFVKTMRDVSAESI